MPTHAALESGDKMKWPRTEVIRTLVRYGGVLLLSGAALALRFAFDPVLDDRLPYWTFWFATAIAVWRLGVGPAIHRRCGLGAGFLFFRRAEVYFCL